VKRRRTCPRGHVFQKSSGCPTCPKCEAARRPAQGFLAGLAAPARRALEGAGLTTLGKLARRSEAQVRELHGMGPNALARLRAYLEEEGLEFKPE
jgi:predicted RecB family nuclease